MFLSVPKVSRFWSKDFVIEVPKQSKRSRNDCKELMKSGLMVWTSPILITLWSMMILTEPLQTSLPISSKKSKKGIIKIHERAGFYCAEVLYKRMIQIEKHKGTEQKMD